MDWFYHVIIPSLLFDCLIYRSYLSIDWLIALSVHRNARVNLLLETRRNFLLLSHFVIRTLPSLISRMIAQKAWLGRLHTFVDSQLNQFALDIIAPSDPNAFLTNENANGRCKSTMKSCGFVWYGTNTIRYHTRTQSPKQSWVDEVIVMWSFDLLIKQDRMIARINWFALKSLLFHSSSSNPGTFLTNECRRKCKRKMHTMKGCDFVWFTGWMQSGAPHGCDHPNSRGLWGDRPNEWLI